MLERVPSEAEVRGSSLGCLSLSRQCSNATGASTGPRWPAVAQEAADWPWPCPALFFPRHQHPSIAIMQGLGISAQGSGPLQVEAVPCRSGFMALVLWPGSCMAAPGRALLVADNDRTPHSLLLTLVPGVPPCLRACHMWGPDPRSRARSLPPWQPTACAMTPTCASPSPVASR